MTNEIILAAGCFWSVQYKLSNLKGVVETKAVYAGGHCDKPTYEEVCTGETAHAEAVYVKYDDSIITTEELITFFFQMHDASQYNRQGPDIGSQYRSAIFYFNEDQLNVALKVKDKIQHNSYYRDRTIVTEFKPYSDFFVAEEYHQNYYKKKGY